MANVETKTPVVAPTGFLMHDAVQVPGMGTPAQAKTLLAIVDSIAGMIELVANKTYHLDKVTAPYVINSFFQDVKTSGTCTAAVKINGTNVTGLSAVSCSTTESETSATAANATAVGDEVTLVISGNASCLDLFFRLKTTYS
jgi:hypothetical protein